MATTQVEILIRARRNMISVDLGKGERGRTRLAALKRIAQEHGITWGNAPSVGRLITAIADGAIKTIPQP